ncbi:uncharacterized protein LOC143521820 [Brachyhypopomus gauderio]|uniref:uncharacterized protein LOC143521820 n=1 Tax=Brachyhypopomus gauderio TaxID=698409 RepID=UPI004041EB69
MEMNEGTHKASYFTPIEQEILMSAYAEHEILFRHKSNSAAAAKQRDSAWAKIADRVNVCNPSGIKRTWQQVKMKYKNLVQSANRKRAEVRKTGGGPRPPPLTQAEELALPENSGRPITPGITGGSSSEPSTPQDTPHYVKVIGGVVQLNEPPAIDDETISGASEWEDPWRHMEMAVQDLCKAHLKKQIEKCDLQKEHTKLQIKRTRLEIELLEYKLKEIKKS